MKFYLSRSCMEVNVAHRHVHCVKCALCICHKWLEKNINIFCICNSYMIAMASPHFFSRMIHHLTKNSLFCVLIKKATVTHLLVIVIVSLKIL